MTNSLSISSTISLTEAQHACASLADRRHRKSKRDDRVNEQLLARFERWDERRRFLLLTLGITSINEIPWINYIEIMSYINKGAFKMLKNGNTINTLMEV
jgi:hypothetical protein